MNIIPYNNQLKGHARAMRNENTNAEALLWLGLKQKQLLGLRFNRQKMVGNYILDFYCKELRLAIEIDGESHELQYEYDRNRAAFLGGFGIRVLRFYNQDVVASPEGVIREIKAYIESKFYC